MKWNNSVGLMRFLALSTLLRPVHSFSTNYYRPLSRTLYWSATAACFRPTFGQPQQQQQPQQPYTTTTTCKMTADTVTGYLNAADASALDGELMSSPGFTLEQLMELAGLSCAEAIYQVIEEKKPSSKPKILVICGPGNNGGDGLVAARHLVMFGYDAEVVYPKQPDKDHYANLVKQCEDMAIPVSKEMPKDLSGYSAIVDSIFGFSFKGEPREPFKTILLQIKEASQNGVLTVSVDVPSGWNVDEGDVAGTGFNPDVLVSLTTPKHCSKNFKGRHFVGGRFLPPKLAQKYSVQMPPYPGVSQVMEIS